MPHDSPTTANGLIIVDKPPGLTSHDVVQVIRRALLCQKVGHAGTLDPAATGVLPICVGKATRLSRYICRWPKEYIASIALGTATATLDATGDVVEVCPVPKLEPSEIDSVLQTFRGVIEQIPPMYSAKRKEGKRLYELARKGITVEREPARVTIHEIELLHAGEDSFRCRIVCSSGTYIRCLADDFAQALHTRGHLSSLRRIAVGEYTLKGAIPLEKGVSWRDRLLSLESIPLGFPDLIVGRKGEQRVRDGHFIASDDIMSLPLQEGKFYRVLSNKGRFLAIAEQKYPAKSRYDPTLVLRPRMRGKDACA